MINILKNQDGISIVSVIAVIIVLLILSGVVISQIGGTDGILAETKKATTTYAEKSIREKVEMKMLDLNIEKTGNATLQDVMDLKNTDSEITNSYKSGNNAILIIDGYKCEINERLEVSSIEENNESDKNSSSAQSSQSRKRIKSVKRIVSVDTADMFERTVQQ